MVANGKCVYSRMRNIIFLVRNKYINKSLRFGINSCRSFDLLWQLIAELRRAKRACGAPWVSKSTHPRKFGNHVTVHRPPARPSAPQGNQCLILILSSQFLSTGRLVLHTYIAHQYCDHLTAVKTGHPLTSIT